MIPTITTIPLLHLASGDRLSLQVYKFIGAQPGKKVYLQANLHGAELAGNAVIHQLIEWLNRLDPTQLSGEIWLVPVCNPLGTNYQSHYFSGARYNPYNGKDWNRIFWDFEQENEDLMAIAQAHLDSDLDTIQQDYQQRIQARFTQLAEALNAPSSAPCSDLYRIRLQSLCLDANYVIDLHTSAGEGVDYLYYFRDRDASARFFLLPLGILLDEYDGDAFDEAFIKPWLALEECFARLNRPLQFDREAWTLELGTAMQLNPASVAHGLEGVKNYLVQKQVLQLPDFAATAAGSTMKFTQRSQVKKYYAPTGGMIQARAPLGSLVERDQRLYQILSFNKQGKLPSVIEVRAEQSGMVYDVSLTQAVNQGDYVLGIA